MSTRWKSSFYRSLAFDQTITMLQYFSSLLLWRGAWNLNMRFVISDPLVGGWVNHVIGTVLLMSLQQFSIIGSCDCSMDYAQPSSDDATIRTFQYVYHWSYSCMWCNWGWSSLLSECCFHLLLEAHRYQVILRSSSRAIHLGASWLLLSIQLSTNYLLKLSPFGRSRVGLFKFNGSVCVCVHNCVVYVAFAWPAV